MKNNLFAESPMNGGT
jgi:hypothetical protein